MIDRVSLSGSFKAMHADVQLFGQDALSRRKAANQALHLTAYSLRSASLGFRQQVSASVRRT